ncbi:MAG: hypothetical protein U0U67_17010 [Chitinophagales bacterium]
MIVFICLTMLVISIPALYAINRKYVQKIALFIGGSQLVLLAMSGKIDLQISSFLSASAQHILTFSYNVIIQKIICLFH